MSIQRITTTIILLPLALGLAGCADLGVLKPKPDVSLFYFLETESMGSANVQYSGDGVAILIGPSSVAKYLDQPQIVTFDGDNRLKYSDQHRWGEPLEESVNRLLIYELSSELNSSRVGSVRFMGEFDWQYRVGYHIYQLGGQPDEKVRMKVSWWVVSRDGTTKRYDAAMYEEPVDGGPGDYTAYVQAIEKMVESWSADVTRTVTGLQP